MNKIHRITKARNTRKAQKNTNASILHSSISCSSRTSCFRDSVFFRVSVILFLSVILSFPQKTFAASIAPGDIIKGSSSTVYYYGSDSKRYLFPNAGVFFSWYPDFSGMKKISDEELAKISFSGRNVVYRPGSMLLKTTTNPKVYAVTPGGTLRWVANEKLAVSLWGKNWTSLVHDVPDSLFSNYRIGENLTKFSYPAGGIVSDGTNTYYINKKGEKQKISAEGLKKNRLERIPRPSQTAKALRVHPAGKDIADSDISFGDILKSEGVSVLSSGLGSLLEVKISSSTPVSHYILKENSSSERVEALSHLASFDFTAGTDGDVVIEKLTLSLEAGLPEAEFSDLYLFLDDQEILKSSPMNGIAVFSAKELFRVSKGTTKTIKVRGDLLPRSVPEGSVKIKISKKEDITANSGVVFQGNFPLLGEKMVVKEIKDLGEIRVASVSLPQQVYVGEKDAELWRISVGALNRNTEIHSLRFHLVSSSTGVDFKNFKLFEDKKQIGSTVGAIASDGAVTFNLRAKPYVISAGQSRTLELHAEVAGGVDRQFLFSFEESADILAFDQSYKIYLKPNGGGNFSEIHAEEYSKVALRDVEIALEKHPTKNFVSVKEANVELAKFRLKPFGEDVRIESFNIEAEMPSGKILNNVRFSFNGVAMEEVVDLSSEIPVSIKFSKPVDIPKDKNSYLVVSGDILSPLVEGDTILLKFTNIVGKSTSSVKGVLIGDLTSNKLTVTSPVFAIDKSGDLADKNASEISGKVGSTNVLIGKFFVSVGPLYDTQFTHIVLKDGGVSWKDEFESVFLVKGDADPTNAKNIIALEAKSLAGPNSVYTFELNPHLTLRKKVSFTVDAYAKKILPTATVETEHTAVILDSVSINEYISSKDVRNVTYSDDLFLQKVYFGK